ncbi:MAG: hypothetical protein HY303_11645 [Candidatus Wallbacteria bacterium]|nr:hypothetical protein [Candidatus Wallbacteria bacterium]
MDTEELNGGWSEGQTQFQLASEFAKENGKSGRKNTPESAPDYGDVRDR